MRYGLLLVLLGVACGQAAQPAPSVPYLVDPGFRRAELVASLVDPANGYSALRLAHYDSGDAVDWSRLPEWNPAVETIAATELDAPAGASADVMSASAAPLSLPSVTSADDPALLALGEAAFARYPAQLASYFSVGLASREASTRYGLWVDDVRGVGGLVRARMADGTVALAMTCSTCHSKRARDGAWSAGLPNADLDVGSAMLTADGALLDPKFASAAALWGPGRLDVTTSTGTEPARIPDLRPVRWLTYLQQDATLRNHDLPALAIRIETLIITSNEQAVRPPRIVALALAAYVSSLADTLPSEESAATSSPHGAALFASQCTSCHGRPALTGEPVPLATIGTDPVLGMSPDRGTGRYRVPSLHGVGTRGPLLHDGTVAGVGAMFDPTRLDASYTERLHGTGAVLGHPFALDLSPADRASLIAYLGAL
jgi:mono/diheme cytochrome c family protein